MGLVMSDRTTIPTLFKSEKHIKDPEWLHVVSQQDCRCTPTSNTDIKGAAQHPPRDNENESHDSPWKRIRIDYFGPFWGQMFLIVVDTYRMLTEILPTGNSSSASTTIRNLRRLFPTFGMPEMIVSDSKAPFTGQEFEAQI